MGEQFTIIPVPSFAEESSLEAHICVICKCEEGDRIFYHPTVKHWMHKRCFEEYTCKKSPDHLCS
ncbi:MAG: hypothetical protein ACTSRK_19150 [Promethearchaeota archaeon]